tara:strand:+ start:887 stop:2086 length:1200 start_codon:yes stop_codon:yes gene_type:complete
MSDYRRINSCDICSSTKLIKVFGMRNFPLTGIYTSRGKRLKNFDNEFLICKKCNHGQLRNQISPKYLYQETYSHRTSKSPLAVSINHDFYSKLKKIIKNKRFNCIFEIGCNDLFLAKKIKRHAKKIVGTDPIFGEKLRTVDSKISVVGGFINDSKLIKIVDKITKKNKIDLVVSSHTFEHVDTIKNSLKKVIEIVDEECLFVVETPSLDSILRNGHFDQIFHQHQHYVSERSIIELCNQLGLQFIEFKYNYQIWGGNVMYVFKKTKKKISNKKYSKQLQKINIKNVKFKFDDFKKNCKKKISYLKKQHKNIVAFGAAQMMPVLAYHSKSDFDFVKGLYDDNPNRIGKYLPYIKPVIQKTNGKIIKNSFVIITANEMCRPIIKRLSEINPLRIITWYSDF